LISSTEARWCCERADPDSRHLRRDPDSRHLRRDPGAPVITVGEVEMSNDELIKRAREVANDIKSQPLTETGVLNKAAYADEVANLLEQMADRLEKLDMSAQLAHEAIAEQKEELHL